MQIDFHHGVTYVCARLAGFAQNEAEVIAHSAQYVDDATMDGEIWFENGMSFPRQASAHKMLDYKNLHPVGNRRVWLPFHFLPGNKGEAAATVSDTAYEREEFLLRCVCRPNSYLAKDLMRVVVERQDRPYALYRLGVAAHVFVDTWAHQGFVGFKHPINKATDLDANDTHHKRSIKEKLKDAFGELWDETKSAFVADTLPLGHGAVLSYPDRPYLIWEYTNGLGDRVQRNNPQDFYEAAVELYLHFLRYREYPVKKDAVFETEYEIPSPFKTIKQKLEAIIDEDGDKRHAEWLQLIANGTFGFCDMVSYIESGPGSWKHQALAVDEDIRDNEHAPIPLATGFLRSHWKLFHDAVYAHRFFVLNELLPKYGLLSG